MTSENRLLEIVKKFGILGIGLCGFCCLAPVFFALLGLSSLTWLFIFSEKIGIISILISLVLLGIWILKRKLGKKCSIDCSCKPEAETNLFQETVKIDTNPSLPVSCILTSEEFKSRKENELKIIKENFEDVIELKNGYTFSFTNAEIHSKDILNIILMEKRCCPFLSFNLRFPFENEIMFLDIFGEEGAKEFIKVEMGL
ncbi:hypothetical protein EHQ23_09005 [Leptospira bourretii]|uniref:Mercuric transport protein MerT n=2 Tax=Leptospira TaxID=171 RepID=A0A4R9IMA8_9LEPT|nr:MULTISPECIES: hypothetical protein [Leptospira]MCW7467563.1 hypothetical protein [Leptospira levettii]MCW7513495.1 hypothetical protein [Leptospira levettii]MCW7517239.1 hypothetical protein [Leptospira levettii]TGK84824.1 hypothetical protein EHQ23_09005 [Leptospira bourretii]TGK90591.1 hypothetical protein EHQ26_10605 [Leptospira bourretii]